MSEREPGTECRPMSDGGSPSPTPQSHDPALARRSQACERCWTRKQRCDRLLPGCTTCRRIGVECLARAPPPNPTLCEAVLTQASLHSYLDSLERNVAGYEAYHHAAGDDSRIEPSVVSTHGASPGDTRGGDTVLASGSSPPTHRSNDAVSEGGSSIGDTMGAIDLLTNSAMAEPRPDTRQAPDRLGLLHSVQSALAIDGHDPSASMSLRPKAVFDGGQRLLPARDDAVVYLRCYLDRIHFIPCLAHEDVESLLARFDAIRTTQPPSDDGNTANALRLFDVYLQTSIGMMLSPDSIQLSHHSVALQGAAVRLLPAALGLRRHIDTLHCLVLLIAFAMFNPNGGSVWHLLGLALRTCITAGLHKDPGSETTLTPQEVDERRWLFWSVYILDRWIGVAMDRPFGIQDRDITVQVPGEREDAVYTTGVAKETSGLQVIRHAQLVSNIRRNGRTDPMFDYSNICYWRDLASCLHNPSDWTRPYPCRDYVDQLACRALIQTVSPTSRSHTNLAILSGTARDVEDDALASCRRFINTSYEQAGPGKAAGSFLDAYDVISAAVVYACLSRRAAASLDRRRSELTEAIYKASTLVTQISARFPALGDFHRLFLLLSSKVAEDQPLGFSNDAIPRNIPFRLRRFIEATFT